MRSEASLVREAVVGRDDGSNTPTAGAGDTAPQAVSVSETRRSVPISATGATSADVVDVKRFRRQRPLRPRR